MNELFSIAGKVAVITGAGGVLGGNIAHHFVQQGAKVVAIFGLWLYSIITTQYVNYCS